jgi:hypothetical protein
LQLFQEYPSDNADDLQRKCQEGKRALGARQLAYAKLCCKARFLSKHSGFEKMRYKRKFLRQESAGYTAPRHHGAARFVRLSTGEFQ